MGISTTQKIRRSVARATLHTKNYATQQKKCIDRKKPVIVATQMLHTMIRNPRPTRAEVSDIANAVYDRTDAIMLSGETAYGDYPLEAVSMMARIAKEVEAERESVNRSLCLSNTKDIPDFLANSAIRASVQLGTKAILTDTTTGRTARYLASFRGKNPIYAQCYSENVARELGITYAVTAAHMERSSNADEFIRKTVVALMDRKKLSEDDSVIVLAGSFGPTHGASFMEISTVKNLLI